MAYSYLVSTASGATKVFSVPEYLSKEHIKVFVDGVPVPFSWVTSQTVELQIELATLTNKEVKRQRTTPAAQAVVDFELGFDPGDLDTQTRQTLYLAQELLDIVSGGTYVPPVQAPPESGEGGGGGSTPTGVAWVWRSQFLKAPEGIGAGTCADLEARIDPNPGLPANLAYHSPFVTRNGAMVQLTADMLSLPVSFVQTSVWDPAQAAQVAF